MSESYRRLREDIPVPSGTGPFNADAKKVKAWVAALPRANAQATEQFYVRRIGADDFMKKPFSRAEVFARIERLLDEAMVPRRLPAAARSSPDEATVDERDDRP